MFRATFAAVVTSAILVSGPVRPGEPTGQLRDAAKAAAEKALPLLKRGAEGHIAKKTCFACHNQAMPMLAITTARERGFIVKDVDLKKQTKFIVNFLDGNQANYKEGRGQGGQVDTAGYALFTLELGGWTPDATTDAVVEYLLQRDHKTDHWRPVSNRPPTEASLFTTNYLAVRALKKWGGDAQKERIAKRIDVVRSWVHKTPTKDTEDRVFRLYALQIVGEPEPKRQPAVDELLRSQRKDGGWGQLDSLDSDAYATGSALVALHQAGGLATSDPAYQRGIAFLLKCQQADGSWHVRSRSKPFQPYYETGFPHGKDQFISSAASSWATTALVLTLPSVRKPPN
jgi:hypothetical protein